MKKKILGISIMIITLLLISLAAASPGFMPEDPDQPVRPLLLEDQTLKEDFLLVIENPDLDAIARSKQISKLALSYKDLAARTADLQKQDIDHPLLAPLESYFFELAETLSTLARAFELTDPDLLKSANMNLKSLDLEFQQLQIQ